MSAALRATCARCDAVPAAIASSPVVAAYADTLGCGAPLAPVVEAVDAVAVRLRSSGHARHAASLFSLDATSELADVATELRWLAARTDVLLVPGMLAAFRAAFGAIQAHAKWQRDLARWTSELRRAEVRP
jgi:hypothetical protein